MPSNDVDISLKEIQGRISDYLADAYSEGIITGATYGRKSTERIIAAAIMEADRLVCLEEKLSGTVGVFVPADRLVIFFADQASHYGDFLDQYSDIKTADAAQFSYLVGEQQFLDIISVKSAKAAVYENFPTEGEYPTDFLWHGSAHQTRGEPTRKYQLTSGTILEQQATGKDYFYVEPNRRKMTLSTPFSGDRWLVFEAFIAPTEYVTEISVSEATSYKIRAPHYAKKLLLAKAMQELLPPNAASEAGFFDLETKARRDVRAQKPGTGNQIVSGDQLDRGMFNDL